MTDKAILGAFFGGFIIVVGGATLSLIQDGGIGTVIVEPGSLDPLLSQEHGPDVECKQLCVQGGHEDEVESDIPVVACSGSGQHQCGSQGAMCGEEHRIGCTENCRAHCCTCCSI